MRFSACLSLITLVATPLAAQWAPGQLPLPRLDARKASRPFATTADTSRTGRPSTTTAVITKRALDTPEILAGAALMVCRAHEPISCLLRVR